ncbi:MAG: hypothetical protein Kow0077_32100 [Anaerolineae bacterium]
MFGIIGTTTADLFIAGAEFMPVCDGDEFTASSLAFCDQPLTITLGGNGANTAYVLARLGAPAMLCSVTGTNPIGALVAGWLREGRVDLRGLCQPDDAATATTTSILDSQHNRLSFYYPGRFPTFSPQDLPRALWTDAHTLLITGYALLPGFREGGFLAVFTRARELGLRTALDIGPAIRAPATLEELLPLLPLVDYLLSNRYEASIATGESDPIAACQQLREAGARTVIIKLGTAGAFVASPEFTGHVPGYPVQARITIGAGDSFNAGLLFALEAGMPLPDAVRYANATAALVVQTGKSALGAPSDADVQRFMTEKERA